MCREFTFALMGFVWASFATALRAEVLSHPPSGDDQIAKTAHYAGPGVVAPDLTAPIGSKSRNHHCNNLDGAVTVAAVIDAAGAAGNIRVLSADDSALGVFATQLVEQARFKSGTYNGVPAPVAIRVTIGMETCVKSKNTIGGVQSTGLVLRANPMVAIVVDPGPASESNSAALSGTSAHPDYAYGLEKVGGRVVAPIPLLTPEARYSRYGKNKHIQGSCLIGLIVDANGMPQNIHVVKSLEPSMDQNAVDAVKKYRFKPAIRDGTTPVPVYVNIQVNFRLY